MTSFLNQNISPYTQELKVIQEGSRPSEEITLTSEHFVHASDLNTVLTNPEIQKHLHLLHERAKEKGDFVIVDDVDERRRLLVTKLNAYNRRSEVGAFKVKISESPDELSYSGPIKFYYQAFEESREICRVVSLSDKDSVKAILPNLREKFKIGNGVNCTLREMINGDEILLDPDDRPLELAVNSKSPVSFHLVAGSDRNTELLRSLQSESFSPEQRRNLIEKYNLRAEENPSPVSSSISTPRHRTSLSGSSASGSVRQLPPDTNYSPNSPMANNNYSMARTNDQAELHRKASLKETSVLATSLSSRHSRSNSLPKNDMSVGVVPTYSSATLGSRVKHSHPTTSKQQNSASRTGRVRQVKQKKDGGLADRRPSRSASARKLFFSLRRYRKRSSSRDKGGSRPPSDSDDDISTLTKTSELSSDANLPGILKIFGDHVSPGANYKSVMATTNSTAKELVKIALERYGLSSQEAEYHVLCEVVGKFQNDNHEKQNSRGLKIKGKRRGKKLEMRKSFDASAIHSPDREFKEDYARPLTDQEKPLVLQSYWKPQEGLCRRFEIRRRSKVFKKSEEDHCTRDVNSQAKRLVLQKSKTTPSSRKIPKVLFPGSESEDDKITSFDQSFPQEEGNLSDAQHYVQRDEQVRNQETILPKQTLLQQNDAKQSKATMDNPLNEVIKSLDRVTPDGVVSQAKSKLASAADSSHSTPPCPYLITLQGNEDNLIHSLDKQEVLIGSDVTDFRLVAPDVLHHHCVIKKRLEIVFSEKDDFEAVNRWCVTINPLNPSAEVRVNGGRISSKHALQHGEMLSVGKHHLFMYKDPSSQINLSSLVNLSYLKTNADSDNCSTEAHGSSTSLNQASSPRDDEKDTAKFLDHIETLLNYHVENEDKILQDIFHYISNFDNFPNKLVLFPATMLCHCVIHSSLNFDSQAKTDLLLKIASTMQTLVLNATKKVSVDEVQSIPKSSEIVPNIIPSLRPVVFWMSNSLEIFGFLQNDLESLLQQKLKEEREKGTVEPHLIEVAEEFAVNEEILALMEEVVMYAFQQLVYYLTKTLYGCLPAILESNPFADDVSYTLNVTQITQVFTQARQLMMTFDVNERISEQLFAYLFFFTNVSLFNTLMEEGSSKYYKWEMGVRIRGNLEFLEAWAEENGCMGQCMKYLEKISALANLLATPRGQFLKGSWTSFRQNFPALTPAQLKKVLTGYHIPGSQSKPSTWNPTVDELAEALNTDLILESYDNHPPLMLPVSGCRLELHTLPEDTTFYGFYERMKEKGVWFSDCDVTVEKLDTSRRERPDGRELTKSENVIASLNHEVVASRMNELKIADVTNVNVSACKETTQAASKAGPGKAILSSSDCSTSSEPEAYVTHRKRVESSDITVKPLDVIYPGSGGESDVDELVVLPVGETTSLASHVTSNVGSPISPSSVSSSFSHDRGMPKEVFIVDIKRSRSGLGVGLIDGLATSFAAAGVYVRSLIPDNPTTKHSPTKHHDVIRCWLQEGRLQLGDRILAANGVSLITMSYYEAIKTIKHAGNNVRLLVGRCGNEVAAKITSSS